MSLFKNRNILWIFAVIAVSFFSFNSLLRSGYIPMHDDMQPIRLLELDKCLKDGQIPCRWVPDLGYGYGYPLYIFYSPLIYYTMEAVHLLGFPILISIKIVFILSFILSGLAMFLLGKALWGPLGGLVSSAFYVYAPYRAADVYSRGAAGEFWALIFLPLILWTILNFIKNDYSRRNSIFLSLSIVGLLLSHNLTSIAFTPVAIIWTILLLIHYKKWSYLPKIIISVIIGFLISAFYIIPLVFEKSYIHLDSMISGYFNYLAHFTSINQLFLRGHWGFGSSELGPYDDLSFSIGTIHWLIFIISVILLIRSRFFPKNRFIPLIFIFNIFLFIFSLFLTHPRSVFIWQSLDFLKYFQFPWRFLVLTMLSTSILAGFPVFLLKSNRYFSYILTIFLILLVIFFNARLFRPSRYININDDQKLSGANWEFQITASIYDYLPIYAQAPPSLPAPTIPTIIQGEALITQFQKGTNWQKGSIAVNTQSTIQLPLFYYPGFTVLVNNQIIPIRYNNGLGLITFDLSPGIHQFEAKLTSTPDRQIADLLTIFGILLLLLYV